jgi:WD40 repeat protein
LELRRTTADGGENVVIIPHGEYRDCPAVKLAGHAGPITSIAFSADNRYVLTSSDDRTVRVCEIGAGALRHVLRGHLRSVRGAAFSPDGRWIATASEDHTARIWDAATGQEFFTLRGCDGAVNNVAFSSDNKNVLIASEDGTTRIWPINPLPVATERKPREPTAEERSRYEIHENHRSDVKHANKPLGHAVSSRGEGSAQ